MEGNQLLEDIELLRKREVDVQDDERILKYLTCLQQGKK
jgi:hypothetical protein